MKKSLQFALIALTLPLLIPVAAVGALLLLGLAIWGTVLRLWFWFAHALHGRCVLFVYSESPNWHSYIEANILPRIREKAVVLNWSERRNWSKTCPCEAWFFRHFAGDHEFNPIALVYCGYLRIRAIRFHQAFLDYKHGKTSTLRSTEAELFALLTARGSETGSPTARRYRSSD